MDRLERKHPPRLENKIEVPSLTVNEGALAYAMLHGIDGHITGYSVDATAVRRLQTLSDNDWPVLVQRFREDPKNALATARLNIFAIGKDKRMSGSDREARIQRYVRAFLDLQVKLDTAAFPSFDTPKREVPAYIPHGLVDMGSDRETDPRVGRREMLRVDKTKMFEQNFDRFINLFSAAVEDSSSEAAKILIIKHIARFIYNEMPYDRKNYGQHYVDAKRIIDVHEVLRDRLAVCRHHALYTQVLLQACGITSRLLKCDADFGDGRAEPHAANVVRVNNTWYLLDATNPDSENGVGEVFLSPLPDRDIDPNDPNPKEWAIPRKLGGKTWKYRSRNNMFYTIQNKASGNR